MYSTFSRLRQAGEFPKVSQRGAEKSQKDRKRNFCVWWCQNINSSLKIRPEPTTSVLLVLLDAPEGGGKGIPAEGL